MHIIILLFTLLLISCGSGLPGTELSTRPAVTAIHIDPTRPPPVKPAEKAKPNVIEDPVISQLYKASLAFVVPSTANINDTLNAQLLIDPSKEVEELAKQLTNKGTTIKQEIRVSKKIIAKLTAADFDLKDVTPNEQALSSTEPTEWLWELRPKSVGNHEIKLTVVAVIKVDNESSEHHIKTFDKVIKVTITPPQVILGWLSKYWQWLISTLIIPMAIFVYKTKFKKKD